MAQPDFPTLSPAHLPEQETFRRNPAYDPVVRPEFEDGIETSRSRVTQVPWDWQFHYRGMTTTNRNTIMTFWSDTVSHGATVLHWIDPTDNVAYFVRFAEQPQAELEPDGTGTWRVQMHFRQALGTYT